MRVLAGFAESFACVESVWSLQRAGMHVTVFARRGRRSTARHLRGVDVAEVTAPEDGLGALRRDVERVARQVRPDAVLPLDDAALWLSSHVDWTGAVLAGPEPAGVAWALDKARQLQSAREAGLHVPPTTVFAAPADVRHATFPSVVKPVHPVSVSGDRLLRPGGAVCADEAELEAARQRLTPVPVLVQPLLHGTGEGVFGFTVEGAPVGWSGHRRVRMVNPQGSASSACKSVDPDPKIVSGVDAMLRAVGWRGEFMAEFLRDVDGTPWLMEVNGRPWGSLALARRRGFEYPAWTVQSCLGMTPDPPVPQHAPPVMCRHVGREVMHVAFVARGPRSRAVVDWPRLPRTLRDLVTVRRGDRLYNWSRHQPAVLAFDTWYSMADQLRSLRTRRRVGRE